MSEVAKLTVSKLETRKYKCANPPRISRSRSYMSDLHSLDSTYEACAICLEEYKDGQELRILPCSHEFHKSCVDPWLIANRTCPLCLYNIMECPGEAEGSLCSTPEPPIQPPAGLSPASHILTSNNNNYHTISYPIMTSSASHHDYQTLQYPSGNHGNLLSNSSHVTSNRTNYANSERYSYSMNGSNTFRESFYGNYSLSAPYTALNYCLQRGGRAESPTSTTGVSAAHAHTTTVTHAHSLANDCVQTRPQMWGTSTKTQLHRAPGGAAKGSNLRYPIPRSVLMAARGRHLNSRARLKAAAQRASSQQWTSSESEVEHKRPRSRPVSMVIKQLPPADNSDTTSPDSDTCSCGKVDKNLDYSNQSTFGSSDLPSDVSSYDSQVYRSRSPAESGHTQNEGKGPPSPPIQPLHLKPTVVIKNRSRPYPKREHRQNTHNNSPYAESKYLHKCGVKNSHKSTNHRLSQPCSIQQHIRKQTSAFSVNKRSPGSDNSLSSLDTSGISPLVSDWGPSSGSDTNENGSRAKYPLCRCPRSPPLEGIECPKCPPPEGIKGTKSLPLPSGIVSASAKAMKDSYTIPLSLTKTTCDVSAGNIPSPMCHLHSPWSGVPSGPGSLSCQICTALKVLPVGQRALSLVEAASQFVKQPSSMTPAILSSRLPGIPYRTEQSDRSHTPVLDEEVASHLARATGSRDASPRRSMVLFTQPQGTFTTIPLEGQESYDPINMV